LEGDGDVVGIITHAGKQCVGHIGAFDDRYAGFSEVGDKRVLNNPTRVASPQLHLRQRYTMVIAVRKNQLELSFNQQRLTTWQPAQGALSMNSNWSIRDPQAIGIGILRGAFEFYDISIREVSGIGRVTAATNQQTLKTARE
jgi:hypothetical protein